MALASLVVKIFLSSLLVSHGRSHSLKRHLTSLDSRCACGFLVNSTSSPTHALFTEILETDFTHLADLRSNVCWQPQQYNQSATAARGQYGKEASLRNVVPNPFASPTTWAGYGVGGGDAGLQLWVNGSTVDGRVMMGEIASQRRDMLYGSFRVGMKLTGVPGTCGAFFYYASDSQEVDMEFLSSYFNASTRPVYLIMQTPESVASGYNAEGTETYNVHQLPFMPSDQFHEYRFDWTPEKVSFYVDSQWLQDLFYTYPRIPGHISLNHWSNGNSAWSRGPPSVDAVITVAYVKAYFNTTDRRRQLEYEQSCALVPKTSARCEIPDQAAPGVKGFGQTPFLNRGMCDEDVGTTSTTLAVAAPTATSGASCSCCCPAPSVQIDVSWWGLSIGFFAVVILFTKVGSFAPAFAGWGFVLCCLGFVMVSMNLVR